MYEKLSTCILPIDDLLKEMIRDESLERELQFVKTCGGMYPVKRLVTLDLVTNKKIANVARKYISKLLENKEEYGYLFFLSDQPMLIPLDVHFKGVEVFTDYANKDRIVAVMEELASEFGCKGTMLYEISLVECYYFFIRLVNPHLTWAAVDYMLNCVRLHVHLIMSPDRIFNYRIEDDEWKEKKTWLCKRA